MDYNYHVPGYSGHQPSFAREFVARPSVPAYKFHFVPAASRSLVDDTRFKSVNTAQTGPETTVLRKTELKLPEVQGEGKVKSQGFVSAARDQKARETKEAFEHTPTANWGTSYSSGFDASKTAEAQQKVRAQMKQSGVTVRHIDAYGTATNQPANSLRRSAQTSNYSADFGNFGSNPLDRTVDAGNQTIAASATSRDLFAGTSKGSARIPGYSGHVPAHAANRAIVKDEARVNLKDNLVQTFRDMKPGFTGYQPKSVHNAKSIRNDRARAFTTPKQVFAASLIVDSMRKA